MPDFISTFQPQQHQIRNGCEEQINHEVNKLQGIIKTVASYKDSNAVIEFDNTKTDIDEIKKAITKTGYSVTTKKEN